MTLSLPTGRSGRVLAVLLLILLLLGLWGGVAQPLITLYQDRADHLDQAQERLIHVTRLVNSLPALERAAEALQARGAPHLVLLDGASDAVAAAGLQSRIEDMAATAGVSLAAVESLPAEARGPYRRIGLKLSVNTTLPVLVALLKSIDEATPPMLIDDLQIHSTILSATPGYQQKLDAGFTLYAFRGTDPTGSAAPPGTNLRAP